MLMEVKMKNNNVLIKEIKDIKETKSGILLPQEKYNRKATVISSDSSYVNAGDTIIKSIGNGTMFNINGEDYEILHESHILAIVNKEL
jgi:co-chaperonin GroES (HSP10)